MKLQITLTGGRKIMNMQKLGTVLQVAKPFDNSGNPMTSGLRGIHYAYFGVRENGLGMHQVLQTIG